MFRVCGFYGLICCGVEGIGGVNGFAMVDEFDYLRFVWWWMETMTIDWVFESCDCWICGLLAVVGGGVARVF